MLSNPYEALEFGKVVGLLRRYAPSPLGQARLDRVLDHPCVESMGVAEAELALVREAIEWLRAAERQDKRNVPRVPRFAGIEDVRDPVRRLSMEGITLDASEIRAILALLDIAKRMSESLLKGRSQRPLLHARGAEIPDLRLLLEELSGKILPNDEISSLASSALSKIRRRIERQRQFVETSLQRFVRRHHESGILRDKYVTMRNGRTVVPVKAQWKGRVDGIVHGASATGQTVFVEPLDTIVQNNRLVRLREDEHAEILRILREMSGRLRTERAAIATTVERIAELEYLFARARFSRDFGCCLPKFGQPGVARIVVEDGRHPLLQDLLAKRESRPVPMSIRLEGTRRTMIVSGPNAGGKTVVLKTVGVLAAMAQAAIPVPASRVEFPWFDEILADIGDDQSISESLSTFSAHISKLTAILRSATPESLVVLDELGTATDPEDGGALAVAVVQRLHKAGGFTIVSTHLPELKMYGARASAVVSGSMGFDPATLGVTYRLQSGLPGQSAGLEMAERFGMPSDVIRRARELKGRAGEQAAAYLANLQRQARKYDELLSEARVKSRDLSLRGREIEREAAERDRRLQAENEARIENLVNKLEKSFRKSLQSALRKLRSPVAGKRGRQTERKVARAVGAYRRSVSGEVTSALGSRAARAIDDAGEEYAPGDRVRIASMGVTGEVVRRLDAGRWEVRSGWMKLQATGDELTFADEEADEPAKLPEGVRLETAGGMVDLPTEINVIGKTADEALLDVDKFLDRAVLANRTRLRVIHGFGKNVLRRELWQMFARHVHVSKYYQAEQHEGGAGATIVEVGGR